MDRFKQGIRSQYPEYYLWIDDKVWLIMSIGVFNLGAGFSTPHLNVNNEVARELDKLHISYYEACIGVFASDHDDIRLYKTGTVENVYKALVNVENRLLGMKRIPFNRIIRTETK